MAYRVHLIGKIARDRAKEMIDKAPEKAVVTISAEGRSLSQNDRMWAMLSEVSVQSTHAGMKHPPEVWKAIFMNACGHEVRYVTGLSGEPFPCGFRSSRLSKKQMVELQDFIEWYCAEHGVRLSGAA